VLLNKLENILDYPADIFDETEENCHVVDLLRSIFRYLPLKKLTTR
jgi:hypothetical protein